MTMTTRRWMAAIGLIALALVVLDLALLMVRDARQKAADERWSDPYLRAEDAYARFSAEMDAADKSQAEQQDTIGSAQP